MTRSTSSGQDKPKSGPAAAATPARPRGGGSYMRLPDGKLEQLAGTRRAERRAPKTPPAAAGHTAAAQTGAAGGDQQQEA